MKKEDYTIFEYNPQGKRLRLMTNETLMYDFKTKKFCINQNPMGEEKLVPISDIEVADDFHEISFSTIYRKQEKRIIMKSQNKVDAILYKFFSSLHKNTFEVQENDIDRIIIVIKNNTLDKIEIYKKNKDYELIDSLRVVSKDNELCFEIFDPEYVQMKIINMKFLQNRFLITTETGVQEYIVETQNIILDFINKLIDNNHLSKPNKQ